MLVPILACAVCPVCLTTYAKVFSVVGVGAGLTPNAHLAILFCAIGISLAVSGFRSYRARRGWPIVTALLGCTSLAVGHLADIQVLEWTGMLVLVGGGLVEQLRLRRLHHHPIVELPAIVPVTTWIPSPGFITVKSDTTRPQTRISQHEH
jgi:hypothetical protein